MLFRSRVWREQGGAWSSVELSGHTGSVLALSALADGRIVSGSYDNTLRVWREQGGAWSSVELTGHANSVHALTTLADGRMVSGSHDNTLRVWRESDGAWRSELLPCSDAKRLVARGNLLFSAGQALLIWDASTATQFPTKRQRLFAIDELVCMTSYHGDGSVDTVRITPEAPDRLWQIAPNFSSPGGKSLPCDPLLHRYAFFLDAKGQHVEVWDCPDQFDWEGLTDNGARTLVLYGKPQTNNLPGAGSE